MYASAASNCPSFDVKDGTVVEFEAWDYDPINGDDLVGSGSSNYAPDERGST
jgi:hypothetical protein